MVYKIMLQVGFVVVICANLCAGEVQVLQMREKKITDDVIANGIREPRPKSVSQALKEIEHYLSSGDCKFEIDLSYNYICDGSAEALGAFFNEHRRLLRRVNLSWNRMTDKGVLKLLVILKTLLSERNFAVLDLRGNYGANGANIGAFIEKECEQSERASIKTKILI